jgi:chemotaxis response regulator CheB
MSSKHPNTKLSNAPSGQKQRPLKAASKQLFPVVGIGASSGGLEACKKLLDCLPADTGMAFILVQHLDPTHASLLVELLSRHTAMVVSEAEEGTRIEADHLYIIPPATYLACGAGSLHLSLPDAPHGARLPYDFLLRSMAAEYTNRAFCLVLSGSGADGSEGLRDIHDAGGYIIVQNPAEAGSDGMPSSAICHWPKSRLHFWPTRYRLQAGLTQTPPLPIRPMTTLCRRSLIICAATQLMILPNTSPELWPVVFHGAWRFRLFPRIRWRIIWTF